MGLSDRVHPRPCPGPMALLSSAPSGPVRVSRTGKDPLVALNLRVGICARFARTWKDPWIALSPHDSHARLSQSAEAPVLFFVLKDVRLALQYALDLRHLADLTRT